MLFHAAMQGPRATPSTRPGCRNTKAGATSTSSCRTGASRAASAGSFYDQHNSGDFERDFAFTQAVGEALDDLLKIVRHRMDDQPGPKPTGPSS